MKYLILAGGGGTRLWPLSRKNKPKQILSFFNDKTLLQVTVDRLAKEISYDDLYICTNQNQAKVIYQQLPEFKKENIILEPQKKDTANAIGFAALYLCQENENESFVTINSDAYFQKPKEYLRVLKQLENIIKKYPQKITMIGVKPTYPETGYGYIKTGRLFGKVKNEKEVEDEVYEVESFVEKPNLQKAEEYIKDPQYFWNPALFAFNLKYFFQLLKKYLPVNYDLLMSMKDRLYDKKFIQETFDKLPAISIDYGLMEKLQEMLVLPADFGWSDIGSWRTIKDLLSATDENLIKGEVVFDDCRANLIYNFTDRLVCALGVTNSLIIQTDDVTCVCPLDRCQEIKKIIEILKKENKEKYL